MEEGDASDRRRKDGLGVVVLAVELAAAAGIVVWALLDIWGLAYPPAVGTVCPLVYPAPPGCGPHARFTPAFVSAIVLSVGYSAVTFLLLTVGRRSIVAAVWALCGLAILGALAVQFVTWGGVRG
ncbi:hypothetical protein ACH47X_12285 [Promicromonospora kroppenstedtii]|uniref:Vitamin K epoxide reductase family protein n=1 Tax=Promicromonospora kroppenstedtii TaxID=440482 RepID=A0ABW7XK54_9MICO